MSTDAKPGPYLSPDQDELYLPVAHYPYNEARSTAAQWAEDLLDSSGRSRYTGKHWLPLHDHEDWEEGGCLCPDVLAWCFDIYEGTWRQ